MPLSRRKRQTLRSAHRSDEFRHAHEKCDGCAIRETAIFHLSCRQSTWSGVLIAHLFRDMTFNLRYPLPNRRFSGDESFLRDPNAFNDSINNAVNNTISEKGSEGEATLKKDASRL